MHEWHEQYLRVKYVVAPKLFKDIKCDKAYLLLCLHQGCTLWRAFEELLQVRKAGRPVKFLLVLSQCDRGVYTRNRRVAQ